jgi:hypothetical protein
MALKRACVIVESSLIGAFPFKRGLGPFPILPRAACAPGFCSDYACAFAPA